MPLLVSTTSPHTGEPLPRTWVWGPRFSFDVEAKTGAITYKGYASPEAAYARPPLEPLIQLTVTIRPERQPAVYGPAPLLSPYVPAQYRTTREPGTNGPDDEGERELVAPAQDPVYGPEPLLRPEVPSFDELVAANPVAYGLLQQAVDQLALDVLPEFAGGAIIPPGPPED